MLSMHFYHNSLMNFFQSELCTNVKTHTTQQAHTKLRVLFHIKSQDMISFCPNFKEILTDFYHALLHSVSKKTKFFPSHKAHRAVLISVSLATSKTPVYTARLTDTGLVHGAVCLSMLQLLLVLLYLLTRDGQAELTSYRNKHGTCTVRGHLSVSR